jgi:hypothetical protein
VSRRPVEFRQRPARLGDGRRHRWSEAKIPPPGLERVRSVGNPPYVCADTEWLAPTTVFLPYLRYYLFEWEEPEFGLDDFLTGGAGQSTMGDGSDSTYFTNWSGGFTPYSDLLGWGPVGNALGVGFAAQPQLASCPLAWWQVKIRYRNPSVHLGDPAFNSGTNCGAFISDDASESEFQWGYMYDQTFELTDADPEGWQEHTWSIRVDEAFQGTTAHDGFRGSLVAGDVRAWISIDPYTDPAAWDISDVRMRVLVGT